MIVSDPAPATAEPTPERNKIQSLEGLRGLMAWWVVIGHVGQTAATHNYLLGHNILAVDVFIILSGFVIFRLIDLKQERYLPYITRRAFRLFPLYLVILVIYAALLPLTLQVLSGPLGAGEMNQGWLLNTRESLRDLPIHFATHALLVQGLVPEDILPQTGTAIIGQAWSVSMEWQFYLIAPAVYYCVTKRRLWPVLLVFAVLLLFAADYMSLAFIGKRPQLFAIGIASYYLFKTDRTNVRRRVLIGALLIALAAFSMVHNGVSQIIPLLIWSTAFLTMLPTGSNWLGLSSRLLGSRLLVGIGEKSYSIYLVHFIPLTLWMAVLDRMHWPAWSFAPTAAVVTVVGTQLISMMTYRWIERPGIDYGARLVRHLHRNVE